MDRPTRPSPSFRILTALLLLALAAMPGGAAAQADAGRRVLRVVGPAQSAPFLFEDEAGRPQGIIADIWALFEQRTGIRVELHPMILSEAIRSVQAGEADVIDGIIATPERRERFAFSPTSTPVAVTLFYDRHYSGIEDAQTARGHIVGVVERDACSFHLQAVGNDNIRRFATHEAMVQAAIRGDVLVFCTTQQQGDYLLARARIAHEFHRTPTLFVAARRWAAQVTNTEVHALVDAGMAQITDEERRTIERRWLGAVAIPNDPGFLERYWQEILEAFATLLAALLIATLALRRIVRLRTKALQESREALQERIKELDCLYDVFRMTEETERDLGETVREVAERLPAGWYQPRTVAARIELLDHAHETPGFGDCLATITSDIVLAGETLGRIVVGTWDKRQADSGEPFLPEERILLSAVAQRLARKVERQRAQVRLGASETRFRRMFEDTRQPVIVYRGDRFVDANRAALDLMGLERLDQLKGLTVRDLSPVYQPDGRLSAEVEPQVIATVLAQGSHAFEWAHKRPNGSVFIVRVLLTVLSEEGPPAIHGVWTDITAQKAAEAELRAYRVNLEAQVAARTAELQATGASLRLALAEQQALFDGATVGIIFTRDRRIVRCNATMAAMLGHEPEELIGNSTQVWFRDNAAFESAGAAIYTAMERDGRFNGEWELRRKDGSLFWGRINIRAIDPRDVSKGVVGIIEDISEERAAREALRAAYARQQAILDAATAGILLIREGTIVLCNRRLAELTGHDFGSLQGAPAEMLFAHKQEWHVCEEEMHTALRAGATWEKEVLARRADGGVFHVRLSASAINPADVDIGYVCIFEDVSVARAATDALRKASEEQAAILDTASSGIAMVQDGRLVRCNLQLHAMLGAPPGALEGSPAVALFDGVAETDGAAAPLHPDIASGQTALFERQLTRTDGSRFWARFTGKAVEPGRPGTAAVWMVDDVSREHVLFDEISRAGSLAEDAARTKADFLANMSHEIRTPMNAIIGMAHLALQTQLDQRQRNYIEKIRIAGHHLVGIIDDVLDLSKIEAGKLAVERVEFDLEQVIGQAASLLGDKVTAKRLELTVDIAPDLPARLLGDPLRIRQILLNYISNAVKFTERGEIALSARIIGQRGDDALVRIAVRDTGIGLSEEQRAMLFQNFQQADTSTSRKHGGTGLGLAISQRLAGLMGGEVGCESEPGHGSTFWVAVPLGIVGGPVRAAVLPPDLQGARMLVVDDNDTARVVLRDMLASLGLAADEVVSGEDAVVAVREAAAQGRPYLIVFLDLHMAGLNGLEVAERIAGLGLADPPRLVVVTADGQEEVKVEVQEAGIGLVLVKPVLPTQLANTVLRLLRSDARVDAFAPAAPAATPAWFGGARILVVEDNPLNQEVARELLVQAGCEVDIVDNGEAALRRVQADPFDLVLMDVQMQGMDGLTATREIRHLPALRTLPIVALTANALRADREACLAAGMNDYLAKPIEPAELFRVLARWITPQGVGASPALPLPAAGALPGMPAAIEGLDMAAGLRRVAGNAGAYLSLLRRFRAGQGGRTDELRAALEAGDMPLAQRLAHTLKGVAGTLGAEGVQRAAAALDAALREGAAPAQAVALLDALDAALRPLLDALAQALPEEAAVAPATEAGPEALARLSAEIAALLARSDIEARERILHNAPLLAEAYGAEFARLRDAVEVFDFEAAARTLATAAAARGIDLPA